MIEKRKYKKEETPILDLPQKTRHKMATHYRINTLDESHVILGFVKPPAFFQTLYLTLHIREAKKRGLIKYDKFLLTSK